MIAGGVIFGVGLGMYTLSRTSHAETESLKSTSQKGNRGLTAGGYRKQAERPGNSEKEASISRASSQDKENGFAVSSTKPEPGLNEDSEVGKIKAGHDESGTPKDNRTKGNSGKEDETSKQSEDLAKKEKDGDMNEESGDNETQESDPPEGENHGPQAFGITREGNV